jgi:hypothetical protein
MLACGPRLRRVVPIISDAVVGKMGALYSSWYLAFVLSLHPGSILAWISILIGLVIAILLWAAPPLLIQRCRILNQIGPASPIHRSSDRCDLSKKVDVSQPSANTSDDRSPHAGL